MPRKIRQLAEAYVAAVAAAPKAKVPEMAQRFVRAIIRRRQRRLLPKILAMVEKIWNERQGIVPVRLTTARAIDARLIRELVGEAPLKTRIEPAIIGGAILERGDGRLDGSVRTALARLRIELLRKEI